MHEHAEPIMREPITRLFIFHSAIMANRQYRVQPIFREQNYIREALPIRNPMPVNATGNASPTTASVSREK